MRSVIKSIESLEYGIKVADENLQCINELKATMNRLLEEHRLEIVRWQTATAGLEWARKYKKP